MKGRAAFPRLTRLRSVPLLLFPLVFLLAGPAQPETLAENQARLGAVSGDVGLLSQGAAEWIDAHEGLPLESGDHLRTGEDGRAEIVASDRVLWSLEAHTELVLEHLESHQGRLDLAAGELLGRVDSSHGSGFEERWEIATPLSVVGVRGTELALTFSKSQGAQLAVYEGTVQLQTAETAEGLPPPMEVSTGHQAVILRGKRARLSVIVSPPLKALGTRRTLLRRRQAMIQNTWSPFTPSVRNDLRRKFVAPPVKRKPVIRQPDNRRPPSRRRRSF